MSKNNAILLNITLEKSLLQKVILLYNIQNTISIFKFIQNYIYLYLKGLYNTILEK